MKKSLLFLLLLLHLPVFAQRNLLLKVDDQILFADTNGKMLVNQRFDDVDPISENYGTYRVYKNGKKGILRDFQLIIPINYDQIYSYHSDWSNHVYIVKNNGAFALVNSMGNLLTDTTYNDIWEFEIDNQRRYSHSIYFMLKQNNLRKLVRIDNENQFHYEIDASVDRITTEMGCVLAHLGKQTALYTLDQSNGALVKRFDFKEVTYAFYSNSFYSIDSKANKVEEYDYNCQLKRTLKGTTKVPEYPIDNQVDREIMEVVEALDERYNYNATDLSIWREAIKNGNFSHLINEFKSTSSSDFAIKDQLAYLSEVSVFGNKGALHCEVKAEYRGLKETIKDTVFSVSYDEIKVKSGDLTTIVPIRKGKLWGAMDVKGREVVPPIHKEVRIVVSTTLNEFIEVQTKEKSYLMYHDVKCNTLDTVVVGLPNDRFRVESNQVFVDRKLKRNKYQVGLTKLYYLPLKVPEMRALRMISFYDSLSKNKVVPLFTNTYLNGKVGLFSNDHTIDIAPKYDSLNVQLCFKVELGRYVPYSPRYQVLQPVVLAYSSNTVSVFTLDGVLFSGSTIKGNTTTQLKVSDDGLFLINALGDQFVDIFNMKGEKLSKQPIKLKTKNGTVAQFSRKYWFVQGKNAQGKDVLVGKNGAWFELPER